MDQDSPRAVRCTAVVRGAVQGVGFRFSAIRQAERLGLVGWVANAPDASVRVVAEGSRSIVEAFVAWLRSGPPAARVDSIETVWTIPTGEYHRFEIR